MTKKLAGAGTSNRYVAIIAEVFRRHYAAGTNVVRFARTEFVEIANKLGIELPKNLGDAIYSFKYRADLPSSIAKTAPDGFEWILASAGRSIYEFRLVRPLDISPRKNFLAIKVPDATPEIINMYAKGDEQSVLAKVRYNRLIDVFLGIVALPLQSHLRTTVRKYGQIEIDELYVGVDKGGGHYIIPVQVKVGKDKHGRQQTEQDAAYCEEKYPNLIRRLVSAQSLPGNVIAMFELAFVDGEVKIVSEAQYKLVPAAAISDEDLVRYVQAEKSRR